MLSSTSFRNIQGEVSDGPKEISARGTDQKAIHIQIEIKAAGVDEILKEQKVQRKDRLGIFKEESIEFGKLSNLCRGRKFTFYNWGIFLMLWASQKGN